MRLLLAALPLLLQAKDEFEPARTALVEAVTACSPSAVDKAASQLAKLNTERCAEAFASAYKGGLELLLDLEKERARHAKEMDLNLLYRDKDGRFVSKGDNQKYFAAKKAWDALTVRVEGLNAALPRAMAIMTRLSSPSAAKGLVVTLRHSEWLARAASAEALGRIDDPAALEALLARAKVEENAAVKVALGDALGLKSKGSEEAKKVLLGWVENPYWQIRLAAAHGIGRSGDRAQTAVLIGMLRTAQGRMKNEVNEALKTLTGVDKHGEYDAWKEWWDTHREEVLAGTYSARATERADARGVSTFYGIPFYSTRVVFVIDNSNSMVEVGKWRPEAGEGPEKPESDRRIDIAKFELKKIVRRMGDGAAFNVVAVHGALTLLGEQMTISGRPSRDAAVKFIQGLQPSFGTNLFGAATRTLEFAGGGWNAPLRQDSIDTIYLLSDGVPTVGMIDRELLVTRTLDTVRYKKIMIHSIAVEAPAHGKPVMKNLAEGTGGQFVER